MSAKPKQGSYASCWNQNDGTYTLATIGGNGEDFIIELRMNFTFQDSNVSFTSHTYSGSPITLGQLSYLPLDWQTGSALFQCTGPGNSPI